ncbi:Ig-like domain-containing protein [Streptomyces rubellomurinus]|uniref:Lipoprotein n=2 Tax=Streptomyces TaxID=1883 RepID=A0A0F2T9E3_STRR3|nr:Ig-like domain-containing protein [Streptomyces rubellomurinus]KJS52860.1 hypothetical protein VM98_28755 [Streptomyces rubellomurinus subsp. indigoferus]KJS59833.1 hypothetical protein VM95_25030 [Streptomyces rubellomurinus]
MISLRRLASLTVPTLAASALTVGVFAAPAAHASSPGVRHSCSHTCHHGIGHVANAATTVGDPVTVDVFRADGFAGGTILDVEAPKHGSVTVNPDSTLTYTPAAGFVGKDCFTYWARTVDGVWFEQRVKVRVFADTSGADFTNSTITNPDTPDIVPLVGGAPGTVLVAVDNPMHGTVHMNGDNTVTYTPAPGFVGFDDFLITGQAPDGTVIVENVAVQVGCP